MNYDDFLITTISKNKNIHGYFCSIRNSVEKITKKHDLNIISKTILGRALTATALMSGNLKNNKDYISLIWESNGSAKKIFCEAWYDGGIRGYIENKNIDFIEGSIKDGNLLAEPYIGFGEIKVLRTTFDNRAPYSSVIAIETGEIAQDISVYLDQAFQIQSALKIGFSVTNENNIINAGGLLLMAMPGSEKEDLKNIFNEFTALGSLTDILDKDNKEINILFEKLKLDIVNTKIISFQCLCSKEKVLKMLKSMNSQELENFKNSNEKIEVECRYCSEKYGFSEDEIKK